MAQVERRVVDRRMLKLLRGWLKAGVFEGGVVSETEAGTPQGSPISPLLCNIALHVLDEAWERQGRQLGVLVRYADDHVALCPTKERAENARHRLTAMSQSSTSPHRGALTPDGHESKLDFSTQRSPHARRP